MQKVGIITHYYGSRNYGGVLQAYALCRVLKELGYESEQISYRITPSAPLRTGAPAKRGFLEKLLDTQHLRRYFNIKVATPLLQPKLAQRAQAFAAFREQAIPHSDTVYTAETVAACTKDYTSFITGSDQVWNPDSYDPAYMLSFVPAGRTKLSYAASLSVPVLSNEAQSQYRTDLADYTAISVREQDAVNLLKELAPVPVEWVLDPTMLLSQAQWDEIAPPREVRQPYLFAYFLGEDPAQRAAVTAFARKRGLKIVTLPHLMGVYRGCDRTFGQDRRYDVSPAAFVSLIKHAEYVVTDSFHAMAFSNLYQKEYFVFQRSGHAAMSTRIQTLAKLFGSEDHFCDTAEKVNAAYMEQLKPIDYTETSGDFEMMQKKSLAFLRNALAGDK